MNLNAMNEKLRFLVDKYSVPAGEIAETADGPVLRAGGAETPLLPWRVERRFVELKGIVDRQTLEGVSTLRFANATAGGDLGGLVAREIDLAVWLTGAPVQSVFAVCGGGVAANVSARLAGELNRCVECATKLPAGTEPIDRHEIIARRGVASDRGVDTQVPQSSIYLYTDAGEARYTDVDTELYGLSNDEIWIVRAAFAVLSNPALAPEWTKARAQMKRYAEAVFASDRDVRPVQL